MNGAEKVVLALALLATATAGYTSHDRFGSIVAFICAAAALSLLAVVVGHATDHLGAKFGPGVTGVDEVLQFRS